MDFDERTEPGTRKARHQRISSQSELDAVALLLGELDGLPEDAGEEPRREVVRRALQKAFDRGQHMERLRQADGDIDQARLLLTVRRLEGQLLDVDAALMAYERDQTPEAYGKLRAAVAGTTKRKHEVTKDEHGDRR